MSAFNIVFTVVITLVFMGGGLVLALVHLKEKRTLARKIISIVLCCMIGAFIGFIGAMVGSTVGEIFIQKPPNSMCQECCQPLDDSDSFCSKCGAERERCDLCGTLIKQGASFCAGCGTAIEVKE